MAHLIRTQSNKLTEDVDETGMSELLAQINDNGGLTCDSQPCEYKISNGSRLVANVNLFDGIWRHLEQSYDDIPNPKPDFVTMAYEWYENEMRGKGPAYLGGDSTTCQRGYVVMVLPLHVSAKFAEVFNTSFPSSSCFCSIENNRVPLTMSTQTAFQDFDPRDRGAFLSTVDSMGGASSRSHFKTHHLSETTPDNMPSDEYKAFQDDMYTGAFSYFDVPDRDDDDEREVEIVAKSIADLPLPGKTFAENVQCIDLDCQDHPLALCKQILATFQILKTHDIDINGGAITAS